jgi:hypothetical protein
MLAAAKLAVNCVLVGSLTFAGLILYVNLPQFSLEPLRWAGHFDRPIALTILFIYTVLVWAVLASVVAWCMLMLKPRNVLLYGLASVATFIVVGQSWSVGNAFAYSPELILALTIPGLYWAFVHMAGRKRKKSDSDPGTAGAT